MTVILIIVGIYLFYILFLKPRAKVNSLVRDTNVRHSFVEPSFKGKSPLEFYRSLDIPLYSGHSSLPEGYANSVGMHIINFISHNPPITSMFMEAVKNGENPCDIALREKRTQLGVIHLLAYEAIYNVAMKNHLVCFESIDLGEVLNRINRIKSRR